MTQHNDAMDEDQHDRDELRRIVLDAAGLGALHAEVRELIGEVRLLRRDVTRHPSLDEVEHRVAVVADALLHAEQRLDRRRRIVLALTAGGIVLALVGAFIGYQVNADRLVSRNRVGYGACVERNDQTAAIEKFFNDQRAIEADNDSAPTVVTQRRIAAYTEALKALGGPLRPCDALYPNR